jgi:hypothetical protein
MTHPTDKKTDKSIVNAKNVLFECLSLNQIKMSDGITAMINISFMALYEAGITYEQLMDLMNFAWNGIKEADAKYRPRTPEG